MKPTVLFDIDGVLADLTHGLTTLAHDLWGTPIITGENQPTWNFRNALNAQQQEAVWRIIGENPTFWGGLPSMIDAYDKAALILLAREADFTYITNRPNASAEVTQAWLETRVPAGTLIHTPNKAEWVMAHLPPDVPRYAIDDAPTNIMLYKDAGIPVVIMDRPYNRELWGKRVKSVQAFCDWVMMH